MMRRHSLSISCVLLATAVGTYNVALAMSEGRTTQNEPFVTGEIAAGEREALERHTQEFNLRIVTAARRSGAYLADAQVKVLGKSGEILLDTRLDGPWLLVELNPGDYTVDATLAGQTVRKSTTIRAGEQREMDFYFDLPTELEPQG